MSDSLVAVGQEVRHLVFGLPLEGSIRVRACRGDPTGVQHFGDRKQIDRMRRRPYRYAQRNDAYETLTAGGGMRKQFSGSTDL